MITIQLLSKEDKLRAKKLGNKFYCRAWYRANAAHASAYAKENHKKNRVRIAVVKKAWSEKNKERLKERAKERHIQNPQARKDKWKIWYAANRGFVAKANRERLLKNNYGLTQEKFEALLASQGNTCACCGGGKVGKHWHVDHDHASNKVRGVLCSNCNSGLGQFDDSVSKIESAITYLKKYGGQS